MLNLRASFSYFIIILKNLLDAVFIIKPSISLSNSQIQYVERAAQLHSNAYFLVFFLDKCFTALNVTFTISFIQITKSTNQFIVSILTSSKPTRHLCNEF